MSIDFVAVDVETANSDRGSICSIGWVKVTDGVVEEAGSMLTKPPSDVDYFDGWNTAIHGITEDDVEDAAPVVQGIQHVSSIVGNHMVVAHNAGFDISAIARAMNYEDAALPEWSFTCSMVLARRELDLISYRLPIVADALGVPLTSHHDAGADAAAAAGITTALVSRRELNSVTDLMEAAQVGVGSLSSTGYVGSRARPRGSQRSRGRGNSSGIRGSTYNPAANGEADPNHPLFGQVVVFTGTLSTLTRVEAKDAAAHFGATTKSGVTGKTTLLVVGGGFAGDDPSEFSTGKARKAVQLRQAGQSIEVLTERDFMDLLDDDA